MICRDFIINPLSKVAGFDYFNDAKDTLDWLRWNDHVDEARLLRAAYDMWRTERYRQSFDKSPTQ